MKKKMSRTQKNMICALVGSSLLWHTPMITYAAENTAETGIVEEQVAKEQEGAEEIQNLKAEQRDFALEGVEVTADRERKKTTDLPPVYAGGQVARGANLGVLGNKDFMDTPFSVTSYTAKTIEDQQASTLQDVLMNDPSVRFTTSNGHLQETFSIRGFSLNTDEINFNGMQGLAPLSHVPVEFLERVEVFKGPNSFLNGSVNAAVGGSINLVPKRAGEEDITTLTTDYTSASQLGGHIDIGRRYGKNKEFGIRFNGVYKDGETETDGQSKERLFGSLGMDYRHDKWRLSLDAYRSEETFKNGSVSMYDLSNGIITAPDGSTNLLQGPIGGTSKNNAVLFKSEYDINANLTAYAGIGKLSSSTIGSVTGNHARNIQADGTATVNRYNQYLWSENVVSELGVRGKYQTGAINHQFVLGSSLANYESANDSRNVVIGSTNIYNPIGFSTVASSPARPRKTSEKELSSLFVADTLSFDKEKVQLTLGMRRQDVHTKSFNIATGVKTAEYNASANTPMVGLVVKPWDNSVSLYANYIEGLSAGDVVGTGAQNVGEVLPPYKSKQQEVGVKWDKDNFANTLSFFQITKPSTMNVYIGNSTLYNVTSDGEQKNRGIEWSTFGKIDKNLRLLGGVAYTQGELTRQTNGVNQGKTPAGIPKWQANIGVEWDTPWNPDLALSFRAIYTSSQYINNTNTLQIPSWVRYDLGASYKTTMGKTPVTFHASIENVFNKNYWSGVFSSTGYATLGSPRTFKLSATMQL